MTEGSTCAALTGVHPVDDGLHGALRGVTVQDNTVTLFSSYIDFSLFLLGGGS